MYESLDQSVGFMLGVAYRKVALLVQQQIKAYHLTPEQWAVLFRIGEEDGLIQREIADRASKDKPTVTRILASLEQKGLIRKEEGSEDRRSFRIFISEAGRDMVKAIAPLEKEAMETACEGIPEQERELLVSLLQQIILNANSRLVETK